MPAAVVPQQRSTFRFCTTTLRWGALVSLANASVPAAAALISGFMQAFSPASVGALAVAWRVEALLLVGFYAQSAVIGPAFMSFARQASLDARRVALRISGWRTLRQGLVVALVALCIAWLLIGLLRPACPEAMGDARLYLQIVPPAYGAYGLVMLGCALLNVTGHAGRSLTICAARLAVLLGAAWILAPRAGAAGIFWAIAISHGASALLALALARPLFFNVFHTTKETENAFNPDRPALPARRSHAPVGGIGLPERPPR